MTADPGDDWTGDLTRAANRARAADRARREFASDLFRSAAARLTDERRSVLRGVFDSLIETVESDLIAYARGDGGHLSLLADRDGAARRLTGTEMARQPLLLAALFRRGAEHLTAQRLRGTAAPGIPETLIHALARAADPALAERAMAMLVADARRQDVHGGPALPLDEVDPAVAAPVVWHVAAVLREGLAPAQGDGDMLIQQAARRILSDHAPDRALPLRALRLAHRLRQLGQDSELLIADAVRHGALRLAASLIAVRADLPPDLCLEILTGDALSETAMLLRMAALGGEAHGVLDALAAANGLDGQREAAGHLHAAASDADLATVAAAWRRDPAFAAAVASLTP